MRTILNVVWFIFGGLWLALGYFLAGIVCCLLIVTIPVGVAAFRMGTYVAWPFGKAVIEKPGAGAGSSIMNILWFVLCGWWLALLHVVTALAQAITIIGVMNAIVNFKMIPVSCFPFGKRIVDVDDLGAFTGGKVLQQTARR